MNNLLLLMVGCGLLRDLFLFFGGGGGGGGSLRIFWGGI